MFSISRPQRKENCWNGGLVKNLILQSGWLWKWKYWMQLFVPHPSPHSPWHSFAISNNKVNSSPDRRQSSFLTAKNKHNQFQHGFSLSFPLPLSVFQFFHFVPTLLSALFHPLSPNQSSVIRQLHKLYREAFAMCVCGVCVERSWLGLCLCTLVRVQSEFTSSWLNIFSLRTKINKWSFTLGTYTHTHTHPHKHTHTQRDIGKKVWGKNNCRSAV